MAGGGTSSREQNFWPGFVDALTNVVLVMVFVVVVFAIALFGGIIKLAKAHVDIQVQERLQSEAHATTSQTEHETRAADLQKERADQLQEENLRLIVALRAANENASRAVSGTCIGGQPATVRRASSELPPVTISGKSPSITVSYAPGVTTLEKTLIEALDEAIAGFEGVSRWQVSLRARTSEPSPSEAQRLAFYRIAVLRDHLVAKGVSPQQIEIVILDEPGGGGRSTVTLQLKKAP